MKEMENTSNGVPETPSSPPLFKWQWQSVMFFRHTASKFSPNFSLKSESIYCAFPQSGVREVVQIKYMHDAWWRRMLSESSPQVMEAGALREIGQVEQHEAIFVLAFTFYAICSKCCEMCQWKRCECSVHELGLPWGCKDDKIKIGWFIMIEICVNAIAGWTQP